MLSLCKDGFAGKILAIVISGILVCSLLPTVASGDELARDRGGQEEATSDKKMNAVLSLGGFHSAVVKGDGSLWMWGSNSCGQLGDGSYESCEYPIKIMENVAAVSLGEEHSAVIKDDGSLWTWGGNTWGQLGDGSRSSSSSPVKIMDNVVAVSLGEEHSAAVKEDGSLWMWGRSQYGQIGIGLYGVGEYCAEPVQVMSGVESVSLGYAHSAAILEDGSLRMWGWNEYGQLGNGKAGETKVQSPIPIRIMDNVVSISLGDDHSIALTKDGRLNQWGKRIGFEPGYTSEFDTPGEILDDVVGTAAGSGHSAAVRVDGSLWTWGWNACGQLGDEEIRGRTEPQKVLDDAVFVSLGTYHSAAIKSDGSLWTWGGNSWGQLGDGATEDRSAPIKIMDDLGLFVPDDSAGGYELSAVGLAYNDKTYDYSKCDVTQEARTIDAEKKDTPLSLLAVLKNKKNPVGKMSLVQVRNKECDVIATASRSGEFKDLKVSQFKANAKLYVYVYDDEGKLRNKCPLALRFAETGSRPSSMSFGDGVEYEINSDLFGGVLKGSKIKANVISCPITWKVSENGTLQMGVNLDITDDDKGLLIKDLRSNGFTKKIEKAMMQPASGQYLAKAAVKPSFKIVGYAEGSPDSSVVKGKLFVEFGVSMYKEFQFHAVVGEVASSLKGKAGATFLFDPTADPKEAVKASIDFGASGKLGVYAGVGAAYVVSAGVYSKASANAEWRLTPYAQSGLLKFSLEGDAGIKVKALGKDLFNVPLLSSEEILIYQRDSSLKNSASRSRASAASISNSVLEESASADALEDCPTTGIDPDVPAFWSGGKSSYASGGCEVLKTNVYQDAQPRMVRCNGCTMLFFLDYDASRTEGNGSRLVYSVLDDATGIWSSPTPMNDDGHADFSFDVFPSGDTVSVAWQKANRALTEDDSIGSIAASVDLVYAEVDPIMQEVRHVRWVTRDNDNYEMMPRVARNADDMVVSWVANSKNSILANEGTNRIMKAVVSSEVVESHEVAQVGAGVVTSLDAGLDGDALSVAWTVDSDGNLGDPSDSSLYSDLRGKIENSNATNAIFTRWNGAEVLSASVDGGVRDESHGETIIGEGMLASSNYDLLDGPGDSPMIMQLYSSEGGAAIQTRLWDSSEKKWSESFDAVSTAGAVSAAAGCLSDDGPVFAYCVEDIAVAGSQNLVCSRGHAVPAQIETVEFPEGALPSDGGVPVEVEVRNAGARDLSSVDIEILDSSDTVVKTITAECALGVGELSALQFVLPIDELPVGTEALSYSVRVAGAEKKTSFEVPLANLTVNGRALIDGSEEKISADVANEGVVKTVADGAKLQFYNWDTDEVLSEEEVPALDAGQTLSFEFAPGCMLKSLGLSTVGVRIVDAGSQSSEYDDDVSIAVWPGDSLEQEAYASDSPGVDDTVGTEKPDEPGGSGGNQGTDPSDPIPDKPISPTPDEPATPNVPTEPDGSDKPVVPGGSDKKVGVWKKSGGRWWYQHADGSYTRNGWELINGAWYYFDKAGWMQTGWLKAGGVWYYLAESGAMKTGWLKQGNAWYYLRPSGAMATGWYKVGSAWYWLSSSGAMKTGWLKQGNVWYYLRPSGAMATGWYKVGSAWYWSSSSGAMGANRWVGNYYLGASGAMATNQWIGKYHVNGSGLWDRTR